MKLEASPLGRRAFTFNTIHFEYVGECAIAVSSGMQNALVTPYNGTVIRTSHFTGILTDLGVEIGHWLRKGNPFFWRMKYYSITLSIYLSIYLIGSYIGAISYTAFHSEGLLISMGCCLLVGLSFAS